MVKSGGCENQLVKRSLLDIYCQSQKTSIEDMVNEGLLFGMGNPLLDIQCHVTKEFLDKWSLKEDDAILCDDKHIPMFHDLCERSDVEYLAGGATQNCLRVCQWILKNKNVATFMGCIAKDKFGDILMRKMEEAGVNAVYQYTDKEKTGTCACCIYKEFRSLCAHLAAANLFTKAHLDAPHHLALVHKAQFYYIAGFALTVCPPAIMEVATHACAENKTFMMNLSAPFLSQFFKEPMMAAMPYVDILFGNETEAEAFAKEHNFGTTAIPEIAKKIAALPKENGKRQRMVIISQGADPVVVVAEGQVKEFPVPTLKKEQLVDTNGAGDSFVGGFLSQFIQGKPLEECVRCGNWAAHVIIQRSGCTFPAVCDYK